MDCCGGWSSIIFDAEQDALQRDADALSAERLSRITGPQLQHLLARPEPLPAQELRAELLREASPGACWLLYCLSAVRCHAVTVRVHTYITEACTCTDDNQKCNRDCHQGSSFTRENWPCVSK